MSLEGPGLASNVVEELTMIKKRVAYLEEENALLKRGHHAQQRSVRGYRAQQQQQQGRRRFPNNLNNNNTLDNSPKKGPLKQHDENFGCAANFGLGGLLNKYWPPPGLSVKDEARRSGRNIWVGSEHRSLQVSHELLGAALPDAVRGFPVAIFAKYEDNVNTAIKGAAIAAERLREQGRYVGVEASFRDNRNEVTLMVVDVHRSPDEHERGALTVASQTDYKVLGGAVANRVRDRKPTLLRAIGKRAVWAATRAVAVAREYVVETGPNLVFAPRFNSVQLSNRTEPSTVVELYVFAM
ncbi:hypothetical protein CTAYLR_009051 [Chrysophaeum taylorii]|uniref:Uncharacterized protein n=1 Tax=Chrysophaeum taylorii TaxID=2483200 RepID=A0AAD7UBF2_9STRA|nr:hypothetical protein CTAYLR_009051 [Chrysophaeum taylorii]